MWLSRDLYLAVKVKFLRIIVSFGVPYPVIQGHGKCAFGESSAIVETNIFQSQAPQCNSYEVSELHRIWYRSSHPDTEWSQAVPLLDKTSMSHSLVLGAFFYPSLVFGVMTS